MTTPPPSSTFRANLERIHVLAEKLGRQSHAGFAMTIAAALDRLLEEALITRMVPLSSDLREKLFGDFGTLSTFAAKINMACAVGLVAQDTMLRLTAVRKIRNIFAHSRDYCDFDSPDVRRLIAAAPGFVALSDSRKEFVALADHIEHSIAERAALTYGGMITQIEADW